VAENLARADKEMAAVAAAKPSTCAAPNNH